MTPYRIIKAIVTVGIVLFFAFMAFSLIKKEPIGIIHDDGTQLSRSALFGVYAQENPCLDKIGKQLVACEELIEINVNFRINGMIDG